MTHKLVHSYDFNTGVQVELKTIKSWHEKVLSELSKIDKDGSYSIASGNSMVIGFRDTEGEIKIVEITNGYEHFFYEPKP